jgi:CRISPR system Cascade subunit CasE
MSRELYMVRLKPDPAKLIASAHRAGTLDAAAVPARPGQQRKGGGRRTAGDYGYPIHQLLTGVFGDAAPKPFSLALNPTDSTTRRARNGDLLAYSPHDEKALRDYADLQRTLYPGWEDAASAIGLDSLNARGLPAEWSPGRRYRFEVRCRPVQRTSRAEKRGLPEERDVFLAAIDGLPESQPVDRAQVYLDWLAAEFDRRGGAALCNAHISAMKRTKLLRRASREGDGGRASRAIDGPDVTFAGTLEVTDSDPFKALLARGLGRHRAFGFGMLLLAPGG